ncbi:hypothetical protein HN51_000190, partial [Arachis hypogaea]
MSEADAIAFRTCSGIERPHLDFVEEQFKKLVLPTGPVILEKPNSALDEKWASWLGEFKQGSMVYCCLGSECRLRPNLFQELLLGLELIGMPFLLEEGFKERVKGRGIVYGGWILLLDASLHIA